MVSPVGCRRLHTLAAVRRIVCLLGASAGFAAGLAGHTCEMLTGYSEEPKPLKAYLGLMGVFGALSVGGGWGVTLTRRFPERYSLADVVLLGVATHKYSRVLTKDRVTSGLRAPFVRYRHDAGPSEVEEAARGGRAARGR